MCPIVTLHAQHPQQKQVPFPCHHQGTTTGVQVNLTVKCNAFFYASATHSSLVQDVTRLVRMVTLTVVASQISNIEFFLSNDQLDRWRWYI